VRKRRSFRRITEVEFNYLNRNQLDEASGYENFAHFASFAVIKIPSLIALGARVGDESLSGIFLSAGHPA
jgi:hypothetical protein